MLNITAQDSTQTAFCCQLILTARNVLQSSELWKNQVGKGFDKHKFVNCLVQKRMVFFELNGWALLISGIAEACIVFDCPVLGATVSPYNAVIIADSNCKQTSLMDQNKVEKDTVSLILNRTVGENLFIAAYSFQCG